MLPEKYLWLEKEPNPKILKEALKWAGTVEGLGEKDNPIILAWADDLGGWIDQWYEHDSIPWCGLFMGFVANRAGFPFDQRALSAKEWLKWGSPRVGSPMLGDVLVFGRDDGGHVGLYVGQDDSAYHVLGGNQRDSVCISRIAKGRLLGARHCSWRVKEPENVRVVKLSSEGVLSYNEK